MSLWNSIKGMFGGASGMTARNAHRLYIVDAERLAESRGGGIGPVERLQTLQRLAQFASREQIRVQAVVGGRPLREVAHGGSLNGITVYYAEQAADASNQIARLQRGDALVITSDAQIEQRIRGQGGSTMKISTLRKAIEGEGGGGQEYRNDRPPRRRGDRPPRRDRGDRSDRGDRGDRGERGDRDQRPPQAGGGQPQESAPQQPRQDRPEPGAETTVKNLIDLVE